MTVFVILLVVFVAIVLLARVSRGSHRMPTTRGDIDVGAFITTTTIDTTPSHSSSVDCSASHSVDTGSCHH